MFVIVTVPLARLVDRLIAKQQARTERGAVPAVTTGAAATSA